MLGAVFADNDRGNFDDSYLFGQARTMRVGGLLLLLGAFVVGIGSAFVVAYFTFDAKPVEVVDKGPTVRVLVAKTSIAVGEEITAGAVVFQDVPVCELPEGAIVNFFDAYRRRPAYPIPPGCPICEDLLIPPTLDAEPTAKHIPLGSQVVVIEVERRHTENARLPLVPALSAVDFIDIRVVRRQDSHGELVERKNNILRTYAPEKTEQREGIGELLLENISIYDVRSSGPIIEGKQYQTVSLLLESDQAEALRQAARNGHLRVARHTELDTDAVVARPEESAAELETTLGTDTTHQLRAGTVEASTSENLQATVDLETQQETVEEPVPENLHAATKSEPEVERQPAPGVIFRRVDLSDVKTPLVVVESSTPESDVPVVSGTPDVVFRPLKTSQEIRSEKAVSERPAIEKTSKSAVVGLVFSPDSAEDRPSSGYSPFGTNTRSFEQETTEPTVPKPLPNRQRFQWN